MARVLIKNHYHLQILFFLIDVSGSMGDQNKLPLLKSAFSLLVNELRPVDHVAIVVYAGAAGLVLNSTPGNHKDKILAALENLQSAVLQLEEKG